MNILKPGSHQKLTHVFEPEMVRSGTISDGSCFFHSILHAIDSKYRILTDEKKQETVKELREKIANSITKKKWETVSNGSVSLVSISRRLWVYMLKYIDCVCNNTTDKHIEPLLSQLDSTVAKIIFEIISKNDIEKIIEQSYDEYEKKQRSETDKSSQFKNILSSNMFHLFNIKMKETEEKYNTTISNERRSKFSNYFIHIIKKIYTYSSEQSFKKYKDTLKKCDKWINYEKLSLLSDYFKRDIYILNGDDDNILPYNIGGLELYKKRKSIILLYLNESHFECLGTYFHITVNNIKKPQAFRDFKYNHPLIQKFYYYLCEPAIFAEKYPDLKQYLPNEFN